MQGPPPTSSAPSNGSGYVQQHPQAPPQHAQIGLSFPGQPAGDGRIKTEPGVKVEPGLENQIPNAHPGSTDVQQRVISNLQNVYGERATASISKLQSGMGQVPNGSHPQYNGQQRPAGQSVPQVHPGQYPGNAQQQYRQQMTAGQASQAQRVHAQAQAQAHHAQAQMQGMQNSQRPNPSQMDGAGDDGPTGVLLQKNAVGQTTELGRVEIDGMLRAHIEARARSMEGGGMMLPLKRITKRDRANPISCYRTPADDAGPARFDGGDDDVKSEVDDEAINSDLDDSDDNLEDDDEDEDGGQIMLCMYDKVQRVKNKWKCVLKDGVLSVNGKDYVFHKATGEYEW
ncbi:transcription factor IIA, alpha/beta subunit [Pseudomassariella vexata]|uniref:Transcription factor IIA, alpha/beta subunit n=1 Tax=Pseudomassariella vexata TaxID=1141098 RepID=A0A1Y2D870_9PEZI|nr:transcription factor IIA, alpha/beta subunit [Pseudomassariella vexata]ORY54835.1 transcription factor IIA, alpha/beta subunit [Pseudomassariella vexata]